MGLHLGHGDAACWDGEEVWEAGCCMGIALEGTCYIGPVRCSRGVEKQAVGYTRLDFSGEVRESFVHSANSFQVLAVD